MPIAERRSGNPPADLSKSYPQLGAAKIDEGLP
jgi:hypothetical protein